MSQQPDKPYTGVPNLLEVQETPNEGILTRTILEAPYLKVVLFSFSAGQELTEHTASVPAVLHILKGQARIGLAQDLLEAGPGTWIHMPASLPHSIHARSEVIMLLQMFKGQKQPPGG